MILDLVNKKITFNAMKNLTIIRFSWSLFMCTLCSSISFGQVEMDSTALQYNTHTKSVPLLRHELTHYIQESRFDELEIKTETLTKKNRYILMVMEKEMLLLFSNELKDLLELIIQNEQSYYSKRNNRTFLIGYMYDIPKYAAEKHYLDRLSKAFLNYLALNDYTYKARIAESNLSEEEKLFLYFYIDLLIHYSELCSKHYENNVLDSGAELAKKYPNSRYTNLAKKYKRYEYSVSDWGWNINVPVISTEIPLKKDMYETIKPMFNFPFTTIGMGMSYKNFALEVEGGLATAKEEAVLTLDERDVTKSLESYRSSLILGYRFHINENFTLMPFIGRRHLSMQTRRDDHDYNEMNDLEDSDPEKKYHKFNFSSRSWYYGLAFDFNGNQSEYYECGKRISRDYHRLTIGLTKFDVPLGKSHVSGNMLVFQYTWGFHFQNRKGIARY